MVIEKLLKSKNLRITKTRVAILEIIIENSGPISAENIEKMANKKNLNIDLSTIYRNVNLLTNKSILSKTTDTKSVNLYQLNDKSHKHHLTCIKCSKMVLIEKCPLEDIERNIEKSTDYEILDHNLQFIGLCPDCKKQKT